MIVGMDESYIEFNEASILGVFTIEGCTDAFYPFTHRLYGAKILFKAKIE